MKELAIRVLFPYGPRAAVWQAVFATLMVLLATGIVHIVTVLLVPQFAARDGYARLAAAAVATELTLLDPDSDLTDVVPGLDPLFVHAACRIDITRAPYGLTFSGNDRIWLMAIYDPRNSATYSLNDRSIPEGNLDMLMVTPAQNARLREIAPQRYDEKIVLEMDGTSYTAIFRIYAPTDPDREAAAALVEGGRCGPTQIAETG